MDSKNSKLDYHTNGQFSGIRYCAPKGNKYWKSRKSHGPGKKIESPQELWRLACKYFQWTSENPLYKTKSFYYKGNVIDVEVAKMRPLSIAGFCLFAGISVQNFYNYSKRASYRDYFEVCERIRMVIYEYNFSGAVAGLLNPCVVARKLGA